MRKKIFRALALILGLGFIVTTIMAYKVDGSVVYLLSGIAGAFVFLEFAITGKSSVNKNFR